MTSPVPSGGSGLSEHWSPQFISVVLVALFLVQIIGPVESVTTQSVNSISTWNTLGGNSARNGSIPNNLGRNRGEVEWTSSGYGTGAGALSPVIGLDGMIYTADGHSLACISPEGRQIWIKQTGFRTEAPYIIDSPTSYSPSIGPDGSIYVGGGDDSPLMPWACLYAISPDGGMIWNYSCEDFVLGSPAISPDGTIYFGTTMNIVNGPHFLHAVAANGSSEWKVNLGPMRDYSSPAMSPTGDIILVTWDESAPNSSRLLAVSRQGVVKWSYSIDAVCESTPAISREGEIYLGADNGVFYAITGDGRLNWTYSSMGRIKGGTAIGSQDLLIFTSSDFNSNSAFNGHIYALGKNGSLKWTQPCTVNSCFPIISRDGVVVAGSQAFNLDGTLRWSMQLVIGSAAAATDGRIYAGTGEGTVVAIFVERSPIGIIVVVSTAAALLAMALVVNRFERKNG